MLIWVYQAYKNTTILTGEKRQWTPGWAVTSHLISVLNLWRPWQVMQEIVHKSTSQPLNRKTVGIYAAVVWFFINTQLYTMDSFDYEEITHL